MNRLLCLFAICGFCAQVHASCFFTDFEDNDLSGWTPCCGSDFWYAVSGQVRVSTGRSCSALLCPWVPESMNVQVSTSGTAMKHVLGLVARMSDSNSGIIAYVSPDSDVARIRLISLGELSTILASLSADFPSHVDYELNLSCIGEQILFEIIVPSTNDHWLLEAVDSFPATGRCGLATGQEQLASWNWFSAQTPGSGSDHESADGDDASISPSACPAGRTVSIRLNGGGPAPGVCDDGVDADNSRSNPMFEYVIVEIPGFEPMKGRLVPAGLAR
ncbi:MAG TPA: hypothetical protein PLF04_08820 [Candidatus Fermentibacter daniensis]|nr:MAG: hypothetical protein AO396_04580 [Candidatus Fermentibacter daniensis]MBP7719822.1 hypothetical protein [Candidatus Fermentibacter sp.]KZD17568.1 MAG: hypothetical protein AO394_05065 [Candidatus Fermentibacter daniensis]KZD19191.1 MAG: hypothetical protein AO395_07900 [Candidatus Fermentibacter daniensis]MCC6871233.1 hypothetical protein [Candidatus Fermentibacter sp.]